jgi:hypothetical protein
MQGIGTFVEESMVPLPLVLTPAYGDASDFEQLLKTSSEELEQESQRFLPSVSLRN